MSSLPRVQQRNRAVNRRLYRPRGRLKWAVVGGTLRRYAWVFGAALVGLCVWAVVREWESRGLIAMSRATLIISAAACALVVASFCAGCVGFSAQARRARAMLRRRELMCPRCGGGLTRPGRVGRCARCGGEHETRELRRAWVWFCAYC